MCWLWTGFSRQHVKQSGRKLRFWHHQLKKRHAACDWVCVDFCVALRILSTVSKTIDPFCTSCYFIQSALPWNRAWHVVDLPCGPPCSTYKERVETRRYSSTGCRHRLQYRSQHYDEFSIEIKWCWNRFTAGQFWNCGHFCAGASLFPWTYFSRPRAGHRGHHHSQYATELNRSHTLFSFNRCNPCHFCNSMLGAGKQPDTRIIRPRSVTSRYCERDGRWYRKPDCFAFSAWKLADSRDDYRSIGSRILRVWHQHRVLYFITTVYRCGKNKCLLCGITFSGGYPVVFHTGWTPNCIVWRGISIDDYWNGVGDKGVESRLCSATCLAETVVAMRPKPTSQALLRRRIQKVRLKFLAQSPFYSSPLSCGGLFQHGYLRARRKQN